MSTYKAIFISGLAMTALLGGCVSLLPEPKPAPIIYRLNISDNTAHSNTLKDSAGNYFNKTVVAIEYPRAIRAISGSDIVLSPDGRRLSIAAGAKWAEPVPDQVRRMLIDELSKTEYYEGVVSKGGTRFPYRVGMDIRSFEAVFDNGEDVAPLAKVQIRFNVSDVKSKSIIGTKMISASHRAKARSVSAIVEAQDVATREAMQEAVKWLTQTLKKEKT